MKNNINGYVLTAFLASFLFLIGCGQKRKDWNNPVKIYDTLCSCKNKDGRTIDIALQKMLRDNNIPAGNTDQINTWMNAHPDQFIQFIQTDFMADSVYMQEFYAARDTLVAHGSTMATKGVFEELFSVKVKYPGCVAAMHLLYQ
ncbi:MAG: hypothetical protein J5I59_11890 [Saprospiraceae bacterium]|nr:hypothetical protein [Saprospiraceae bacterium]